jgi:hypothetical protein
MMIFLFVLLFWLACGLFATGALNAAERAQFPPRTSNGARESLGCALLIGLMGGPIAVLVAFFCTGFLASGWTLSAYAVKDRIGYLG